MSATTCASTRDSVRRALPVSSAISRASSSTWSRSTAAHCATSAPRFRAGMRAHAFCARSASTTAASTSALSPSAARPTSMPVAGLTTANVRPERAGVSRPPMKCWPDSACASARSSTQGASLAWIGRSSIGFPSRVGGPIHRRQSYDRDASGEQADESCFWGEYGARADRTAAWPEGLRPDAGCWQGRPACRCWPIWART